MVWVCQRDPDFLKWFLVLVDGFHYGGAGKKNPHARCAESACAASYTDQVGNNHSLAEQHNAATKNVAALMPYLLQTNLSALLRK